MKATTLHIECQYCAGKTYATIKRPDLQFMHVLRGLVEYAECNDPGNPWIGEAKIILEQEQTQ